MTNILETCFSGPVLPASVLLLLVVGYWLLVIVGSMDIDVLDLDLDLDTDVDAQGHSGWFSSTGGMVLRFLNLGEIPVMIWLTVFALSLWITSVVWYHVEANHDDWLAVQILLRNSAVALIATKLITQPMTRLIDRTELRKAKDLLGCMCTISTMEVTERHGQAKVQTEGAPLLLHVRTRSGVLAKGDSARIVDYDPATSIYYVEKVEQPQTELEVNA